MKQPWKQIMSQSKKQLFYICLWSVLSICAIGWLSSVGLTIWATYRDDIIQQQKEQMLVTVESLAGNLEDTIQGNQRELGQLADELIYIETLADEHRAMAVWTRLFSSFLSYNKADISHVILRDRNGDALWSNEEISFPKTYKVCRLSDTVSLSECKNSEGEVTFLLSQTLPDGRQLEFAMDILSYYHRLISDIKIGTNGYIVVKNSDGIIFMHPEPLQLGINVIEGRASIYPGLDLSSLDNLVEQQNENDSGIYEYYSYWWTHEELPLVDKIAAHAHAAFGDDFMVVSAVMDYNDIYAPIQAGFTNIALMFGAITLIVLLFLGYVIYLALQQQKNHREIAYLRDLNQVLEETKRTEDTIIHQQRLQIMGTMTGGIAHEFNNMLTPIMGYADILQCGMDPDSDEFDSVQEILNATDRAKDVIQQISSLSKKNMETVFDLIHASAAVGRAVKMIRPMCPANMTLDVDNQIDQSVVFLGNETQLSQILLNLVSNAIHAIGTREHGVITLSCRAVDRSVPIAHKFVPSEVWDQYVELQISDNGCGMEQSTIDQIFNPFFTTKIKNEGVGLGLSMVEQMVNGSKGYITVASQSGTGTSFFVYFPVVQQGEIPTDVSLIDELPRILILDDNERVLQLLGRSLTRLGLAVTLADTREDARNAIASQEFHAIFIDQHLFHGDGDDMGIQFAMSLHGQYPNLIKIIMTDQVCKEIIEAKQKGFIQNYIEKPVSNLSMINVLRESEDDALYLKKL